MTAVRILRANASTVDGEITESQLARMKADGLVIECPECTKKIREAITDAHVYHPNAENDGDHARVVGKMERILTERAN